MAQENRQGIRDEALEFIPTNNRKEITAEMVRDFMEIINLSKFNLLDDTLANIQLNNTSLGANAEEALQNLVDNTLPVFYIEFRVYDGNTGNPYSLDSEILNTDNNSVTIDSNFGSTVGSQTDICFVNFNFQDLGFDLRSSGGLVFNQTRTSCSIAVPAPGNNTGEKIVKIYFFKDF